MPSVRRIIAERGISPDQLAEAIRLLPEPVYAELSLWGAFDYSALLAQAGETLGGAELDVPKGGERFALKDPTKEKVLGIYRKSFELQDPELSKKYPGENPWRNPGSRRIDVEKVGWELGGTRIEVSPYLVDVYSERGSHGDSGTDHYVSQVISHMRRALAESSARLRINGIEIDDSHIKGDFFEKGRREERERQKLERGTSPGGGGDVGLDEIEG